MALRCVVSAARAHCSHARIGRAFDCGRAALQVIQAGKFDLKTTNDERDLLLKAIMQRQREGENEDGEESPVRPVLVRPPDDDALLAY